MRGLRPFIRAGSTVRCTRLKQRGDSGGCRGAVALGKKASISADARAKALSALARFQVTETTGGDALQRIAEITLEAAKHDYPAFAAACAVPTRC